MKENKTPVIAIFDIGKTNKKLFLFDEDYKIVFERSARFNEIKDEDGDPCENLESLRLSAYESLHEVFALGRFDIKAVNFATYGASFVYIDGDGKPLSPLYNYLKTYPAELAKQFYATHGHQEEISLSTASPVLGSLNSGMQLYRLKYEQPEVFSRLKHALHLPQYMSLLLTGVPCTDVTSIGCHTQLWDFNKQDYHTWVKQEKLDAVLPEILPANEVSPASYDGKSFVAGTGLHDSSAALIPYLVSFREPFALISTGTWCITLNPFNHAPLTPVELTQDCLCYLTYTGKPVKASRIFSGNEHEQQTKRLAMHFGGKGNEYRQVALKTSIIDKLRNNPVPVTSLSLNGLKTSVFGNRNLVDFDNYEEAYHQLIMDLVEVQVESSMLVLKESGVQRIFVDGGFGKNTIFMYLLAAALPTFEVFAASIPQATALGAALAIHKHWNTKEIPSDLIELKYYATPNN